MIGPFHINRPAFGDALELARQMPDGSVNCIVTSPPYWGLRDYGHEGQIGLEETPEEYTQKLVDLFDELRRVLRDDGTCWVNLGDSYTTRPNGPIGKAGLDGSTSSHSEYRRANALRARKSFRRDKAEVVGSAHRGVAGLKHKDLVGIPWRVAFALQASGWYLRQDIIWHKPNPMPESVTDRCTKAHEYLFLFSKRDRYWYDAESIKVKCSPNTHSRGHGVNPKATQNAHGSRQNESFSGAINGPVEYRNKRSVWRIPTAPYSGAHFAVFPPALIVPCILAGCPAGGVVLDPFLGSGTTGEVAERLGRKWLGFEINPDNAPLIEQRTKQSGLFGRPSNEPP